MTLYPQARGPRLRTIGGDLLIGLALILLGVVAMAVHDAVADLAVLGRGVQEAGGEVRDGFASAADAVDGVPVVGGEIAGALRGAGEGTGGEVVDLGREGEDRALRAATILGWAAFLLPAGVLLALWLPGRIGQARRLAAARRVLGAGLEHRRLVAMRAAFSLPYGQLLRHTPDPLGDLDAGRYDALIAAELDSVGLSAPRSA